jgi:hypothetical protein
VNLVERLALKLALGRLKRAVNDARKRDSTMMKAADGWKTAISALAFVIASVVMLVGGVDVRQVLLQVLQALGWGSPGAADLAFYAFVANTLLAVVGLVHRGWKAYQQWCAGVPFSEVLSTEGYVKRAIADRQLPRLAPLRHP